MVIVNPIPPHLPSHIPHSFQGKPLAHLYLQFDPSLLTFVRKFIIGRGYDKNFVSLIILDLKLVSACVLLSPKSIESVAIDDLNGETVRERHKLIVLPFSTAPPSYAKAASRIAAPRTGTTAGAFKLAIGQAGGKHLPEYIIEQHITEHFIILWGKIVKIVKCKEGSHSFFIFLASAESAHDAVAIFNDSLLNGIQITVKFVEWEAKPVAQGSVPSPRSKSRSGSGTGYEACKLFVYSNPKFPNFISEKDLLDHFKEFNPFRAYIIMKEAWSTGVGVVFFPSKDVADNVMEKMVGTKVLNVYTISLKYEDPSRPPKSPTSRSHAHHHTHGEEYSSRSPDYSSTSPTSPPKSSSDDTISRSLKVSYLPEEATVKKLAQLFGEFGELDGEPVMHFKGGSNPYAHVNFRTKRSAQRALEQLNHTPFEDSVITVKCVHSLTHTAKKGQRPH